MIIMERWNRGNKGEEWNIGIMEYWNSGIKGIKGKNGIMKRRKTNRRDRKEGAKFA